MAGIPLRQLKDCHKGADIWIIAAGPSAGLIEPCFFANKITVGVNRIWNRFSTTYLVIKESAVLDQAISSGARVIASRFNCGALGGQEQNSALEFYFFEHLNNGIQDVDLSVIGTDKIVVSYSTITSAMHIAAYLGAANIILVGHDCGILDGQRNFEGYPLPLMRQPGFYDRFLSLIEPQSLAVRERLRQVYGCRIYSLNPFLNFGLEDHKYERTGIT